MPDISIVTATARNLIAEMLDDYGLWAVLHVSEPTPTDPLATIAQMSGQYSVKIDWVRTGSILVNASPLTFAGVADMTSVTWIAITTDATGKEILFAGEVEEPEISREAWDVFTVPAGAVEIVVA